MSRLSLCVATVALAMGMALPLAAQEAVSPPEPEANNRVIEQATTYMEVMELRRASDRSVIERIERPLLVFGDSARSNSAGTLWAWQKAGRPLALLELYRGLDAKSRWANAVTLTSPALVTLKTSVGASWEPAQSQFVAQSIDDTPAPEEKGAARLRQMKELARQFTAHEFWEPNNSRFELRLLVQPVLRYSDSAAKVLDGAVFVLAHGTNPEIVLLIEAIQEPTQAAKWQFAAMRLGSAEMHLERNGKEVWKQERTPGVVGKPADAYWLFMADP